MSDLAQIERLLRELGIEHINPARLAALIRFVQRAEGHRECFGDGAPGCEQGDCAWRSRCPSHGRTQREVLERLRPPGHLPG